MNRLSSLSLLLIISFLPPTPLLAQQGQPPATKQQQKGTDEQVSITTNLVQVDVIVTDKDGKQVTDLRPEEFEITEDGKKQAVTNFSYISNLSANSTGTLRPTSVESPAANKSATTSVPPARLRPEQVRRTIAFLVDDLGASFESTKFVRDALRKFVDEQMQPGDLVAILRTSGGASALQQFTTDKRLLNTAIENIRWLPRGRGDVTPFDSSINPNGEQQVDVLTREAAEDLIAFRGEILTAGTIGAINLVLRGLENMPGRKSVVLFSENARIFDTDGKRSERLVLAMKQMADLSNRYSAIVYTVDTSGLQTLNTTSAQNPNNARVVPELGLQGASGPPPVASRASNPGASTPEQGLRALDNLNNAARATYFDSQGVLKYLADLTGGLAFKNSNDISGGIQRVLDDQSGFYLIGYRPEVSPVDPKTGQRRALKVNVKVKRPNLRVRARSSFYGFTDEETRAGARTRDQQLIDALNSPFAGDIRMRLTSLFGDDRGAGSFVRAMVYVDARDLKFSAEPDGGHRATLDLVVMTSDGMGRIIDQLGRTETVTAKDDIYQRVLQQGLTYVLNVPVKQAGSYQVRIAVRDSATEKTGSASQFVSVPDLTRGGLTLSGIILSGISTAATQNTEPDPQAGPAVRRLKQGMFLNYGYVIYNAQLDKSTGKPQLSTQMRLFKDGKPVFTGRVASVDVSQQKDMMRVSTGGRLQVGSNLTPGDYVLQVIVTDMLVKEKEKEKRRTATQWIDFEVVQ